MLRPKEKLCENPKCKTIIHEDNPIWIVQGKKRKLGYCSDKCMLQHIGEKVLTMSYQETKNNFIGSMYGKV